MKKIQNQLFIKKQANQNSYKNKQLNQSKNNGHNTLFQEDEKLLRQMVKKVIQQRSQQIKLRKESKAEHISKRQKSIKRKDLTKNQDSILQKIQQMKNQKRALKSQTQHPKINLFKSKIHCSKCNDCNCGKHLCKNISHSQKDPSSKFISVYKKNSQQVTMKYGSQRPQLMASYLSDRISKVPTYNPKFESLYSKSQYSKDYENQSRPMENSTNFNHLKLSNVKLGEKNFRFPQHFQSAYNLQYKQVNSPRNKSKDPFVVNNPQHLNTFGLKYHSNLSNYGNAYKNQSFSGKRQSLRPGDTFKQLDLCLTKQSAYQQKFSLKKPEKRQERVLLSFLSRHPHLSSSLSKQEPIGFRASQQSSYKKQFQAKSIRDFACPCTTHL